MRVDRLLGEHGIRKDTAASREEFERRMEARRLEEEDEETIKPLRQGWCLGSAEFRQQMLDLVEGSVGESHDAALRRESAACKAERIIAEELARLGWTEADLEGRRKSDAGKLANRGAFKKRDHSVDQEYSGVGAIGEFQERQLKLTSLDARCWKAGAQN
jgi:hypothetical protein